MANFNQEVIGLHDFCCYPACGFVESDTPVICHVLVFCFGLFLLQDMCLKLQAVAFERQNLMFAVNVLLTCILVTPGPAMIRTVCKCSR